MAKALNNYYVNTFGVDLKLVISILANLEKASIITQKNGTAVAYDWDKTQAQNSNFGTTATLDQQGKTELIDLKSGFQLVTDWLNNPDNNVPSQIIKVWRNPSIPLFQKTNLVMAHIKPRLHQETLSRGALHTNLNNYQRTQAVAKQQDPFQDLVKSRITEHNQRVREPLRKMMESPDNAQLISRLFPTRLLEEYGDSSYVRAELTEFVVDHLDTLLEETHLYSDSRQIGTQSPVQPLKNLGRYIQEQASISGKDHLSGWNLLLADDDRKADLLKLTQNLERQWLGSGKTLLDLKKETQSLAALTLASTSTKANLQSSISTALEKYLDKTTAQVISKAVINESIRNSATQDPYDTHYLIETAIKRAGIKPNQQLTTFIADEYGPDIRLQVSDLRLHLAENPQGKSLVKSGIDPRLTPKRNYWDNLAQKVGLTTYQPETPDLLQDKTKILAQSQSLLQKELAKPNPNPARIRELRLFEDYLYQSDQKFGAVAEFKVRIGNTFGRLQRDYHEILHDLYDKYETITGQKAFARLMDQIHEFQNTFTVQVKIGGTLHQIPIFNLQNWAFDQFASWKIKVTSSQITKLQGSTKLTDRLGHWFFRNYQNGDYTLSGFGLSAATEGWGKLLNWAVKAGSKGKYATTQALATAIRQGVATRVIAWGTAMVAKKAGSALGRWLIELGAGIGTGSLAIPLLILDVVLTIGWEVAKWAWANRRKLFAGLFISASAVAIAAGGFLQSLPGMFGSLASSLGQTLASAIAGFGTAMTSLLGVFGLSGGILLGWSQLTPLLDSSFKNTARLTPHVGERVENIYSCEGAPETPPDVSGQVEFAGQYAFPVVNYTGYGCYHWDGTLAVDIFTGQAEFDDPPKFLPVVSYSSGVVEIVEEYDYGGKALIIRGSDNRYYYYAHNCTIYVNPGDSVTAGQVIAITNQTGINAKVTPEHLHFAISASNNFQEGGTVCAQEEFIRVFGHSRCGRGEVCRMPVNVGEDVIK